MRFEAKTFVRVVPRSHFSPDADKKRYRDSRTMRSPTDLVSTPRGDDDCFLGASSLVRTWFHFATREISLKSMIRTRFPLHRGVYSIHKHVFPSFNLIRDIRCRKQQLARLILHQAGAIVFEIVSHLISYSYVSLDNWYLLISGIVRILENIKRHIRRTSGPVNPRTPSGRGHQIYDTLKCWRFLLPQSRVTEAGWLSQMPELHIFLQHMEWNLFRLGFSESWENGKFVRYTGIWLITDWVWINDQREPILRNKNK